MNMKGEMPFGLSKLMVAGIVVVVILLFLVLWFVGTYNSLINLDQTAEQKWSDVESTYQRRFDLIPNLESIVTGSAEFESSTLKEVTALRAEIGKTKVEFNNAGEAGDIAKQIQAAGQFDSALSRLLVVVENYPDIKSTQAFRDFMTQLEGTENRINFARKEYNAAAKNLNTAKKQIPTNIVAGFMNLQDKAYFEATTGAENAPDVEFNFGN